MTVKKHSKGNFVRCIMTIAMLLTANLAFSQDEANGHNGILSGFTQFITKNAHKILDKTEGVIEKYLDAKDSIYITPNKYNFTVMPQYSYNFEYYRFSAGNGSQGFTLMPDISSKAGLYIGWRWLFIGYSFNLDKGAPQRDFNFSFYTSKIGIDLFYRKRDKGFRVRSHKGFSGEADKYLNENKGIGGLTVRQKGVNVYYIFNNKKFSYPAAYSQTTIQRISAGSFILGINYNEQSFSFDHSKLSPVIQKQLAPELKFKYIKYKDFGVNFGYSYNWVFAHNCLANISVTPAIGYKNTSLRMSDSNEILSNINFDLITRAAIVYNNGKYFAGASVISHTYSYRKEALSILNGFGVINIYAGFNFWRKKQR